MTASQRFHCCLTCLGLDLFSFSLSSSQFLLFRRILVPRGCMYSQSWRKESYGPDFFTETRSPGLQAPLPTAGGWAPGCLWASVSCSPPAGRHRVASAGSASGPPGQVAPSPLLHDDLALVAGRRVRASLTLKEFYTISPCSRFVCYVARM